ncbi:hypothetical protein Mapa_016211 [Marchantia paleacea]|nr:hypothetical protein Mapa_016211 [Marchantia paleacea]
MIGNITQQCPWIMLTRYMRALPHSINTKVHKNRMQRIQEGRKETPTRHASSIFCLHINYLLDRQHHELVLGAGADPLRPVQDHTAKLFFSEG